METHSSHDPVRRALSILMAVCLALALLYVLLQTAMSLPAPRELPKVQSQTFILRTSTPAQSA